MSNFLKLCVCVSLLVSQSVVVALAADTYSETADAIVAEWTEALAPTFRELAELPEEEFTTAWQSEYEGWISKLRALPGYIAGSTNAERFEARIYYEWAIGRLLYPRYQAGVTSNPDYQPPASYYDFMEDLALDREDYLDLEEYTGFLVRKRNIQSDEIIEARGDALNNGARDLTAKRLANRAYTSEPIRCFLERQALEHWLEDYDADGLTTEPAGIAAACPGPESDSLLEQVAAEQEERDGHTVEVFKSVDGHDLEIHVFVPEGLTQPAPVMVWLHGGGWYFGSWSWCGPCTWYKDLGMVVAQVEYRITGRHGSEISDSYEDALDAIEWIRTNAAKFGGDPARVGVSGFSAGGHLSMAAATLAPEGASRPDLSVSISGCTDLLNDPYTVRLSGGEERARALSPRFSPNADAAPIFMVNAQYDSDCSFEEAEDFAIKQEDLGADIVFLPQPNRGHFFLRDADRTAQTRAAVEEFLTERGF